jgi:hypothetical protein
MPTPLPSRHAAITSWSGGPNPKYPFSGGEWRCTQCDKLLGVCRDSQMHLRFARGHEYFVGFPVVATCRGCGTLNKAEAPVR